MENPVGGYGKTVSHLIIGLKTAKGTKQLKLDPSIYESIQVTFHQWPIQSRIVEIL